MKPNTLHPLYYLFGRPLLKLYVSKLFLLIVLLCTITSAVCKANDLVIVHGNEKATIVLAASPAPVEQYAAQELQRCIRIMTGVELTIVNSTSSVAGAQIVIGTPATNSQIAGHAAILQLTASNDEQTAVLHDGNILFLAGQTPRAALYATYTFLQDVLGIRWLWPGDSGEFIPRRTEVTVNGIRIFESPRMAIRSLAITDVTNSTSETDTWEARNKFNIVSVPPGSNPGSPVIQERLKKGFQTRVAGHNVVLSQSILTAHPEYVALYNGSRSYSTPSTAQLCWGNPGVQNEVANMIAGWWNQSPFIDIVHFYPADNQRYCQDDLCKALAPDVSTRWQKFSQIVMEKVDQTRPGKKYWTFAYQGYKSVPTTVATRFENVGYTMYEASYRHLLSSGYSGNQGTMNEIDGWLSKGVRMGIRGYEYITFKDPMTVPLVSWEVDQMSWMVNKGLTGGYSSELPPYGIPRTAAPEETYWNCNRLNLYAAGKAMWSNISADSIVKDWCAAIYGPADSAMRAYYWDFEQAWRNAPGSIGGYNRSPAAEVDNFLSPFIFEKLNGYISLARTKLASVSDTAWRNRIEAQIDLERKMLANWQSVYLFKKGRADHFKADIVKTAQIDENTWKTSEKLPPFEEKNGAAATEQTIASMSWTSTNLVLRFVCQDNNMAGVKANATTHDGAVTADDCIELFIQPNPAKPTYMHLAANSKAIRYDAISILGGLNVDTSWNPDWTATTSANASGWILTVSIPFSSLGILPQDSSQFKMAVKRSRAARTENSGWPDASYFNPAAFGLMTMISQIVNPVNNKIILYDNGITTGGPVSVEFQLRDWTVAAGVTGEAQLREKLNEDAAVLLIKYTSTTPLLSTEFYLNEIKQFMDKGRLVIIAAARNMPIETWFPGTPAIQWSGNSQQSGNPRTATYLLPGAWQTYPNNLITPLTKSSAPVTAYSVLADGWRIMAKMRMINGTDQPFLLSRRIGNSMLVLTSSAFGYSGGYEMFGNNYLSNVVKLVENLKAEQQQFANTVTTRPVTVNNEEGLCAATVRLDQPSISNDVTVQSITNDHPSDTFPVGVTTVTWTVTDAGGNVYTAAQKVTVTDNEAPVISCTADISLSACENTANWNIPQAVDNCSGVTVTQTAGPAPGSVFENGTADTITYTATDAAGNSSFCSFTVSRAPAVTASLVTAGSPIYFGLSSDQFATIQVMPAGGVAPYKVSVTMDRPLHCNVITSAGDETWVGDELTTGSTDLACPAAGASNGLPVSVANVIPAGGVYSLKLALMENAVITATVTDANGCTAIRSTGIQAQDVRCFSGDTAKTKIKLCHKTGNTKNPCVSICVDRSAVEEHLAHGDFFGNCTTDCTPVDTYTARSTTIQQEAQAPAYPTAAFAVKVSPNPASDNFRLNIQSSYTEKIKITVMDVAGRVIEQRTGVPANTMLQIGRSYAAGIYFVAIVQGNRRLIVRLIKTDR